MKQDKVSRELGALPPEAQKQVMDYIAFLRMRYMPTRPAKAKRTKLAQETFVGIWRTRKDMRDSRAWVRNLREREWMSRDG
jgi:hypothetical protein